MSQTKLSLRQWREKKAMSQSELANLTQLSQSTISKLEKGVCRPTRATKALLNGVVKVQFVQR